MTHTRTGFYVTVKYDTWRNRLCGPFMRERDAFAMIGPVRRAMQRSDAWNDDLRLSRGTYMVERVRSETLRPGTMDYSLLRLEDMLP